MVRCYYSFDGARDTPLPTDLVPLPDYLRVTDYCIGIWVFIKPIFSGSDARFIRSTVRAFTAVIIADYSFGFCEAVYSGDSACKT